MESDYPNRLWKRLTPRERQSCELLARSYANREIATQKEAADRVRADMEVTRQLGLNATPSFVVQGTLLIGPSPETLSRYVRAAIDSIRGAAEKP